MCVQVSMSTCVCVCMWRPVVTAGCFPQSFSTFIFDPGAHWFARVCWQRAHGNPLASDSLMLSRLTFCAGVEAQVLLPVQQHFIKAPPQPLVNMLRKYIYVHTRVTCFGLFCCCMTGCLYSLGWSWCCNSLAFTSQVLGLHAQPTHARSLMHQLFERTLSEVIVLVDHTIYGVKQL